MPRKPRARVFMFDPDLFLSDPAVRRMTLAALGAYVRLLCEAWRSHDPGILEGDDDTIRRLSGADSTEWPTLRPQVAAAFDVDSKPGTWIQKRVRQTYREQNARHRLFKKAGTLGSKTRWNAVRQSKEPQQDEWPGYGLAIARPMANNGSTVLGSKTLGSVATEASLLGVGNSARGLLSDATHLAKKDPQTEREIVRLDTRLATAGIGPKLRELIANHFRANAGRITSPDAYYRPGTKSWDDLIRDLSAQAEVNHHRTEEPR